jgi:hypothetical protein
MARRTQEQWRELLKQHADSGKTATAFCADHGLNAKYFSILKQKFAQSPPKKNAKFITVKTTPIAAATIDIQVSEVTVRCPANRPAQWVAELVRALC